MADWNRVIREVEVPVPGIYRILTDKVPLSGAYLKSTFTVLSMTHLCTYERHMSDGTVQKDNFIWTADDQKAETADLLEWEAVVGTRVRHKKYGLYGRLERYCTTATHRKFTPLYPGADPQQTNWWGPERRLRQFVWVRWERGPKGEILQAWTNMNDIEFIDVHVRSIITQ